MKTRITVNRHRIAANKKRGTTDPVFSIQRSGRPVEYSNNIKLAPGVELIYRPDKPLGCGAVVFLEVLDNSQISY